MSEAKDFYERYWEVEAPPEHDRHAPERRRLLTSVLRTVPRGAAIVDYGCGHGELVAYLSGLGFVAEGVDIADAAIAKAHGRYPGLPFYSLADWVARPADVGVCFEVIEHVLEPRALLGQLHSILKPGGHLALTTPYHGRLKNLALALYGFDRHYAVEGPHIRFFTDAALRRLLRETGFRVLACRHFGRLPLVQAGTFLWAAKI